MDSINEIKEIVKKEETSIEKQENFNIEVPKIKTEIDTSKTYSEQAKDLVGVMATKNAIEDEELVKDVTETKKEELRTNAEGNLKQEKAKSKDADKQLQIANYGVFEGVATYAGIIKPLPIFMQKCLFGILAFIQTLFLVFLGTGTSIINIVCDCFDSIVKKLSGIAKSARVLIVSLIAICAIALVSYIVIAILQKYKII